MKVIIWIVVIWIIGSLIYGVKQDSTFLAPFKRQYEIFLEEHKIPTIIITIIGIWFLIKILF